MQTSADSLLETKTREQLAEELQKLAKEAEALIQSSGDEFAEQTEELQRKLKGVLDFFGSGSETIAEKAKTGAKAADEAIRRNPYPAIGVALLVGLLAGVFMKRR